MPTPQQHFGSTPEPVDMFDALPQQQQSAQVQPMQQPLAAQPAASPMPTISPEPLMNQGEMNIPTTPPRKKKKIILLCVLLVVCMLIGVGAYAGYSFYYSPQRVAKKTIENFLQIKTVAYAVDITPEFVADQPSFMPVLGHGLSGIRATIAGHSDMRDQDNPRGTADVSLYMSDSRGGEEIYSFETKSIDHSLYLNISRGPSFPSFPSDKVENQWIELNTQKLAETFPLPRNIKNKLENVKQSKLTNEQKQQLKNAFVQHPFISLGQRVGAEDIHGVKTNHYTTTVDKEVLKAFLQTVQSILNNGIVSSEKIDEFLQDFDHASAVQFDVWIGKKDYQLYQWKLVVPIDTQSFKSLSVTGQLWDHNVSVDIAAPEDAVPLDEFIQTAFGIDINALTKESTPTPEVENVNDDDVTVSEETTTTNGDRDSDADGLSDEDEQQYGTDPKNLDSDSDGYTDWEEVEYGYNPMGAGALPASDE